MQDIYYWSPSTKTFLPEGLKQRYLSSGSWPDDARQVSIACWQEYGACAPPEGKVRDIDTEGFPIWVNLPAADRVAGFLADVQTMKARAVRYVNEQFSILNEVTPEVWVTYIRSLDALRDRTDLDAETLPDIPDPPEEME